LKAINSFFQRAVLLFQIEVVRKKLDIGFVDHTDYKKRYEELLAEKAVWETYKSQLEIKVQLLERTEEETFYQLFNWMCLAIRLDTLSRSEKTNGLNIFDKEKLYEQLTKDKIPFSSWPKMILQEVEHYSAR